jgi:hypothetical protein
MLTEELNLIILGDDWHEVPYHHRHKADIRVKPDVDLGYTIHILQLGIPVWEWREIQDALRLCSRYQVPEIPKMRGRMA